VSLSHLFPAQANEYAAFRPKYPSALCDRLKGGCLPVLGYSRLRFQDEYRLNSRLQEFYLKTAIP
jgi:hypothetical protein